MKPAFAACAFQSHSWFWTVIVTEKWQNKQQLNGKREWQKMVPVGLELINQRWWYVHIKLLPVAGDWKAQKCLVCPFSCFCLPLYHVFAVWAVLMGEGRVVHPQPDTWGVPKTPPGWGRDWGCFSGTPGVVVSAPKEPNGATAPGAPIWHHCPLGVSYRMSPENCFSLSKKVRALP